MPPNGQAKHIVFLTGTRADYGKLKPLMQAVQADDQFKCTVFVTGMHTLDQYGYTVDEVRLGGFRDIHVFHNQLLGEPMDLVLANTIRGLAGYVSLVRTDLIVVHGDRVESLAGAIVGAMRNIRTAHIEGGELSGTVDELIRHAVSKLAHTHFVANAGALRRLRQMGEASENIYVVGSPDIDVMLSDNLPGLTDVKAHYEIPFDNYAIALFHPVTTEVEQCRAYAADFVDALFESGMNYVVVFPNNDHGTSEIQEEYARLTDLSRFRLLPSLRFEYFLTLLKYARFIVGNSSAGIREAPVYGIPTVNIGTRQKGRFMYKSIINASNSRDSIVAAIKRVLLMGKQEPSLHFGAGNSRKLFMDILHDQRFWDGACQKSFVDLDGMSE